jgi:beta-glucanase (GH16 family)
MKKSSILLFLIFLFSFSCEEEKTTTIVGFKLDSNSIEEGNSTGSKTVTVTIEGEVNSNVSVRYELQPLTAKDGEDFLIDEGTLEFSSGNTKTTLAIEVVGDSHLEITENFNIAFEYNGQEFLVPVDIKDDDIMGSILSDEDGFYTPATYPSMQLTWSDEFEGTALNAASWTPELGNGCSVGICGWGNNELQVYTDKSENVKLDNGKLVITAIKTESGGYTSARIKTENKRELKYGRIDVRAKLPKGQGLWPAIWMLGENIDLVGWPTCGEIDIMELRGGAPSIVEGTVHYNNDGYKYNSSSTTLSSGDFSQKFHVFSIVWDFNTITWYVDNKEFKKFSNSNIASWPFNKPFFFIMNVAVGGNYGGPPNETTVFPQQMTVDYIRVFQ